MFRVLGIYNFGGGAETMNFFSVIFHVKFNPNQEKNLLGYKVVDYSNNLNGVFGKTINVAFE